MWLLKKFAAVIITFLFVAIALIFFFYYLNSLSVNKDKQVIETNSLEHECRVYQHTAGVKHIISQNEYDAYFMIGYVHASDRLFQMDMLRRTAKSMNFVLRATHC